MNTNHTKSSVNPNSTIGNDVASATVGPFAEIGMLQLADSFFPAGMYTMSNGLEFLFYENKKMNSEEIKELIKIHLEQVIGPADCTALGNSYEASIQGDISQILAIDDLLYSIKLVKETRDATARSGKQMLRCLSYFLEGDIIKQYNKAVLDGRATGVYPVSLAVASSSMGISKQNAGIMLMYGYTVSMVGAALRLGMLQHFEGQKIVHDLKEVMINVVSSSIERSVGDMWQFAPHLDIIQTLHERMEAKMFIT